MLEIGNVPSPIIHEHLKKMEILHNSPRTPEYDNYMNDVLYYVFFGIIIVLVETCMLKFKMSHRK